MRNELTNRPEADHDVEAVPELFRDARPASPEAQDEQQQGDPVALPAPAFQVRDAASASWVLRKVNEARAYARRVQEWAAGELRRAEREEQWLLTRFGRELEDWLRSELAARGGRRRSVSLPGGTLGLRQSPARMVISDESEALTWCRTHLPDALKASLEARGQGALKLIAWGERNPPDVAVRPSVLVDPLRTYVERTGDLPPGVDVRPASDQLYVK